MRIELSNFDPLYFVVVIQVFTNECEISRLPRVEHPWTQYQHVLIAKGRTPSDSIPKHINCRGLNTLAINTNTYQMPRVEHPRNQYQHDNSILT